MTEPDYKWLANDNLPGQPIRVVAGSEWHYAGGGWHETDPVPELTAADLETEPEPVTADVEIPEPEVTTEDAPEDGDEQPTE